MSQHRGRPWRVIKEIRRPDMMCRRESSHENDTLLLDSMLHARFSEVIVYDIFSDEHEIPSCRWKARS